MTCHYSAADWRDVLYNSVRAAPGGVNAAAAFLAERRGRTMHAETLRARLRGVDGDSISMEIAELLTEWLQDLGRADARDWLHVFNARFGLVATDVGSAHAQQQGDVNAALRLRLLRNTASGGRLAELGLKATDDNCVDPREAEAILAQIGSEQRELQELADSVRAAAAFCTLSRSAGAVQ